MGTGAAATLLGIHISDVTAPSISCGKATRRILNERARRRVSAKGGAGAALVDVDENEHPSRVGDDDQLPAVNEVLEKFALTDPRKAEPVNGRAGRRKN